VSGTDATIDRRFLSAMVAVALVVSVGQAHGSYISNDERVEAQAELSVQNTFQHNDAHSIEWVQDRNEIKAGLRYFLVPVDQDLFGILHRPRLSIQYRGRYDSVYDVRDVYQRRGFNRDDYRFPEGEYPREMYFDGEFVHPLDWLSFRIGRQQVVWGEADLFRSLDVINPLRLDQNGLIGERFDDYREPLLIAKFLARLGDLPLLSNAALEFFYSPNSQPLTDHAIVSEGFRETMADNICLTASAFTLGLSEGQTEGPAHFFSCRRPTALPFNRTRSPWEISRVGPYATDAASFAVTGPGRSATRPPPPAQDQCRFGVGLNGGCGDFMYGINDGWPRSWLSLNSSMAGVRLFGQTFEGLDVSFDYIFKRTEVPGTSLSVSDLFCPQGDRDGGLGNPVTCRSDGGANPRPSLLAAAVTAAAPNPITNPIEANGFTRGINQQVRDCIAGKPEIIFASLHGMTPFSSSGALDLGNATRKGVNGFTGCEKTGFWYPWTHILGTTATYNDNRYTGFIWRLEESYSTREPRANHPPLAADRSGQFPDADDFASHLKRDTGVWRSMIGFDYLRSITSAGRLPSFVRSMSFPRSLLTDQWFFTFQFFDEYYTNVRRTIGLLDSPTDRQQQFNPTLTYVMTGFFANDRFRPFIAAGYDVNASFPVTWVQGEYFLTPRLSMKVADIEYMGSSHAESYLFLNKYADRDTFFVKLTYFLL
jgi:hypothetical protein